MVNDELVYCFLVYLVSSRVRLFKIQEKIKHVKYKVDPVVKTEFVRV